MFWNTIKKKVFAISCFSRGIQAIRLLLTFSTCIETIRVFRLPGIKLIKKYRRWIALKYVGNYLGRSFSCRCRGAILVNHYNFIYNYIPEDFIKKLIPSGIVLWEELLDEHLYTITLEFPYHDMEGDLAVVFNIDSHKIATCSFTIMNGNMVNIDSEHVIFIARVQGTIGCFELIKQTTKVLKDITPNIILVIAVQAIAAALKIGSMAGIITKKHIFYDAFDYDYDQLWISMGGVKINKQVFQLSTKPKDKPMHMIKRNHRCRTKKKRVFKRNIYNQIILAFEQRCLNKV